MLGLTNFVQANDTSKALEEKNENFYFDRGNAYIDKGNFDKVIDDFTQAIKINSIFADAYYNRGSAYMDKGELNKAIIDFNKVLELEPDANEAKLNLKKALELQAQSKK